MVCSLYLCSNSNIKKKKEKATNYPTGTRWFNVDSTWISRRYVEGPISTNFHVIFTNFFDVISMVEKSTWFPRTFFNVISMVEKSALFPRTFISVISMVEICTLFLLAFSGVILMGKDLISFLVSYKLMKTFEKVFLVFVTLNCCFQVNLAGVAQFH